MNTQGDEMSSLEIAGSVAYYVGYYGLHLVLHLDEGVTVLLLS